MFIQFENGRQHPIRLGPYDFITFDNEFITVQETENSEPETIACLVGRNVIKIGGVDGEFNRFVISSR